MHQSQCTHAQHFYCRQCPNKTFSANVCSWVPNAHRIEPIRLTIEFHMWRYNTMITGGHNHIRKLVVTLRTVAPTSLNIQAQGATNNIIWCNHKWGQVRVVIGAWNANNYGGKAISNICALSFLRNVVIISEYFILMRSWF